MDTLILIVGALFLGMRHGMDPDHLVAVDGMVRANATRPRLARRIGLLFALGHGGIVTAATVMIALAASRWAPPAWLGVFGTAVSACFLIVLAAINLRAISRTDKPFVLRGIKSRFFGFAQHLSHPLAIIAVGMLFAISFDTLSQAALFTVVAANGGGWLLPALMGFTFTAGMMVTDSLNGLWCARLVARAGRAGDVAARITGLVICMLSLAVAAIGIAEISPSFRLIGGEFSGLVDGVLVIVILGAGAQLAMALSRRWSAARTMD
jgi:high-affinity nickel-transport protein